MYLVHVTFSSFGVPVSFGWSCILLPFMFLILLLKSFMSTLDIRVPLLELIIKLLALVFIDDMDLFTFALANELIIQTAMRL